MGLGICLDIQFLGDADGADPGQHLENHVPKVIEVFRSKDSPLYRLFGIVLVSNPTLNLPRETRPLYNYFQKEALMGKP